MPRSLRLLALLLVASLIAAAIAGGGGYVDAETLARLVRDRDASSMVVFVALVVAFEMLWLPRVWGLIAGGALFGPFWGAGLSLSADLITGAIGYSLARGAARDWAAQRLQRKPRARRLLELLTKERGLVPFTIVRMLPIHWTAISYGSGIAGIPPRTYYIGTLIGALPGAVLMSSFGDAVREPIGPQLWLTVAGLVLVAIAVGWYARKRFRR